jgi:hypothetical protein
MKTIAVVTSIFLHATFVAVRCPILPGCDDAR